MHFVTTRRTALAAVCSLLLCVPAAATGFDHTSYDAILQKAVKGKQVDYRAVGNRMKDLDVYLTHVGAFDINKLNGQPARLAFYANAYNALVLKAVVMNRTPASVMKVPGFFDKTKYLVAGEMMTLNELEQTKLRSAGDPRVHFLVNCASVSCPPLHGRAYTPENWAGLLEQQTKQYLQRRGEVMIDNNAKTITIVPLFDWYRADFENDKGVRDFLTTYLPDQAVRLQDDGYTLKFYEYDWKLNRLQAQGNGLSPNGL